MTLLRLLYRRIDMLAQDESWIQQNFVSLLRLVPAPPWKHPESLEFLTDIATTLNEILPEPLSSAASNAALIVEILEEYIRFHLTDDKHRSCGSISNLLARMAITSKLNHGVVFAETSSLIEPVLRIKQTF